MHLKILSKDSNNERNITIVEDAFNIARDNNHTGKMHSAVRIFLDYLDESSGKEEQNCLSKFGNDALKLILLGA